MVLNVLFGENLASTWLYLLTDNFFRCPQSLLKLRAHKARVVRFLKGQPPTRLNGFTVLGLHLH